MMSLKNIPNNPRTPIIIPLIVGKYPPATAPR